MRRMTDNKSTNEFGFTLVEVLVSVLILTLILTIFLNVFLQSASLNKASHEIIDVTYIAQKEMENLYQLSLQQDINHVLKSDYQPGPIVVKDGIQWESFKKKEVEKGYNIRVRTRNIEDHENLIRIIIEVFDGDITNDERNLESKMENIFYQGDEST